MRVEEHRMQQFGVAVCRVEGFGLGLGFRVLVFRV